MGNYVDVDEVKLHSQITYEDLGFASEADYDSFLNDLITQAEAVVEDHCRVPSTFFKAGGLTFMDERYDYDEGFIALRHYPVLEVLNVDVNVAGYGETEDWVTLDPSDYVVYPDEGLIKLVSGEKPSVRDRSVKLTYKAGYTTVPEAVKFVCVQLCSNYLHAVLQRKVSPIVRVGDFAVRLVVPEVFTEELKKMLLPYARSRMTAE
ncbi:hypothetical protein J7L06_00530 [Candidatus Bathyarchaeota archaeon]|nr:hypothetical protein [Candidatus Bathyarchaeota archaeon]